MDYSNSYLPQFQNFLFQQNPANPTAAASGHNPNPNLNHNHNNPPPITAETFASFHLQNPNPTPPPHPPYPEMIKAAIGGSIDGAGSGLSKQAISKQIEKIYGPLLPDNHANELATSLQALRNSGEVVMVKHSYKLAGSGPALVAQPVNSVPAANAVIGSGVGASSHRKRGRPRKFVPSTEPSFVLNVEQQMVGENVTGVAVNEPVNGVSVNEKVTGVDVNGVVAGETVNEAGDGVVGGETVTDTKVLPAKRVGRPPKVRFDVEQANGMLGSSGEKKARGRPKKNVQQVVIGGPAGTPKRSPGRPPKSRTVAEVFDGPVQTLAIAGTKRRGWPKGLPRGGKSSKVQKWAGLSKVGLVGSRNLGPAEPQWMVDYAHIRSKFEYIQSKMKKAIGVIKPHLINQSTTNGEVSAALQELDQISSMDVMAVSLNTADDQPEAMVDQQVY